MIVGFIDTVHPILWERLKNEGHNCIDLTTISTNELHLHVSKLEGIVIRSRLRMDEDFLSIIPDLKFIARSGAGMENIDEDYCQARGIMLFNAPEGNMNAVAEHALGMLLALFNNIPRADTEVRQGTWRREENRGIELEGKTVGIIGYGNNGSQFAKVLSGFGIRILAYDKYKSGFSNENVVEVNLETIQEQSDVLSLHIPLTDETKYMVDRQFMSAFNKSFFLINLSRGKVVKTEDLLSGLKSGKIQGACLDVLEYESSSFEKITETNAFQEELMRMDNVLFSPHVGGWTEESYFKLSNVLADKIVAESDFK